MSFRIVIYEVIIRGSENFNLLKFDVEDKFKKTGNTFFHYGVILYSIWTHTHTYVHLSNGKDFKYWKQCFLKYIIFQPISTSGNKSKLPSKKCEKHYLYGKTIGTHYVTMSRIMKTAEPCLYTIFLIHITSGYIHTARRLLRSRALSTYPNTGLSLAERARQYNY